MRIAKATQAGRHRKAQALQWLLTHSRAAKLLAVHRVTTNRGAKTPGVDNVIWRTGKQKLHAVFNLKRHGYIPQPLRRLYLPKPNGKLRSLSIPVMHDRARHALHALSLAPIAEVLADRNSYGFREGRRCADALEQCFTVLSQKSCVPWVQEGDIRACFDEISHSWLLQNVPRDKQLLEKWLQAGYWEKGQLFPTSKGTPQGGLMTPRTQWITCKFRALACSPGRNRMVDRDQVFADRDLLYEHAQQFLSFNGNHRLRGLVQAAKKSFHRIAHFDPTLVFHSSHLQVLLLLLQRPEFLSDLRGSLS
jgi:retron-type reverse transcriptase